MWVWASGSKPRSNKAVIGNKGVKPESIIKPDRWIDYSSIKKKHNTNHISIANTLLFPTLYPSLSLYLSNNNIYRNSLLPNNTKAPQHNGATLGAT